MIKINYEGRHGNFIFQYIFSRYISYLTNHCIFEESNYNKYTGNNLVIFKDNLYTDGNSESYDNSKEEFIITDTNAIEIIEILRRNSSHFKHKNIIIGGRTGYYQNSSLYQFDLNFIKSLIKYTETPSNNLHCDETVVIHLRLDDFHRNGIDSEIIDFNYYDDIIKQFNYKHIHIVYSKPENSPYKKRMLRDTGSSYSDDEAVYLKYFQNKYNAVFVASNVAADFNYFQNFKNIILSASSFGFWATANIQHKCKVHIPIHPRCNATCETSDILKWCGHDVHTYSKVEFLNFNEIHQNHM